MGLGAFICAFVALWITVIGILFYEHTLAMFLILGFIVAGI